MWTGKNQIADISEMEDRTDCDTDKMVSSVLERRRNFLHRLDSWRHSRIQFMTTSSDLIPTSIPVVHVKNSNESATQTDAPVSSSDVPTALISSSRHFHTECPLMSEYLHRCI